MKCLILGCSTAFPGLNTFNQSFLLEENGKRLLIDCGEDIPKALIYHGIDIKSLDGIYLSHLHSDHSYGIPRVALARYDFIKFPTHYSQGNYAPKLYGKQQVLDKLWDTIKHPLETLQNIRATLDTFFEPVPVTEYFIWEGWKFKLIQQVHVVSDAEIMPSFGLLISKEGHKTLYLTTDSQYCSPRQIEDFYKISDIIIQDCELIGINAKYSEGEIYFDEKNPLETIWKRSKFFSGVHANYAQLAGYDSANSTKLNSQTKAKMWLSHYQDFKLENKDSYGNFIDWDKEAIKDGFAGFVKTGQIFEL